MAQAATLALVGQTAKRKLERTGGAGPEDYRVFVGKVKYQTDRLSRLVDDMLDITRIQEGRMKLNLAPDDLALVVRGVVERFAPQVIKKGGDLRITRADSARVLVDLHRIEQVIGNLLINAVKYGPGTSSPSPSRRSRKESRASSGTAVRASRTRRGSGSSSASSGPSPRTRLRAWDSGSSSLGRSSNPIAGTTFLIDLPILKRP